MTDLQAFNAKYKFELSPDERISILTARIDNLSRGKGHYFSMGHRGTALGHAQSALQEAIRDKRVWGGQHK